MHIVVTASGDVPTAGDATRRGLMASADLIIAADGGLAHCVEAGVWPNVVIGDMDSVAPEQLALAQQNGARLDRASAEKDETDLELALRLAAEHHATTVTVIGLFGGRVDHELANIGLVASQRWHDAGIAMAGNDGNRRIWVVHDSLALAEPVGTTISVLPWGGPAVDVSNSGFEWPLDQATLPAGTPRGMSNVASAPTQHISVGDGVVLVIIDATEG